MCPVHPEEGSHCLLRSQWLCSVWPHQPADTEHRQVRVSIRLWSSGADCCAVQGELFKTLLISRNVSSAMTRAGAGTWPG